MTTDTDTTTVALVDPVWTKAQAAQALGVTPRTVETLHRTGRLRGFIVAGKLRWRASAVETFAQRCEGGPP